MHKRDQQGAAEELRKGKSSPGTHGRDVLGSIDWGRRGLGAHADAEEEAGDEELLPCLRKGAADDRESAEDATEEDDAAPAKPVVERV